MTIRNGSKGFTLIELLVVVAIIGILAAMAIGNMIGALQRARQKRTMADIRTIANAWEARAVDVKAYNAAGFTVPGQPVSFRQMDVMLAPTYTRFIPENDGWSRPFLFAADSAIGASTLASDYAIVSAGRDGAFTRTVTPGSTTNFDCDIVYSGGKFIAWPEGQQQQ